MPIEVTAKLAGRSVALSLSDDATISQVHDSIRAAFELPPDAGLRILAKGKQIGGDVSASALEAGLAPNAKLMVMQTRAAERSAVEAARPERMRGFEEDDRRLRSGGVASSSGTAAYKTRGSAASPYRFGGLQVLPVPPGATPGAAEAEALLRRLSTDASILHLMSEHKFSVGKLSEMPPEGQVGVSASCLMGLNKNAGQEILLRLRTDDWAGLRPYHTLIEVLLHELTHNVWGDHDDNFKALNSQLQREYKAHASARTGQTIGGASFAPQRAESPPTDAGHLVGGSSEPMDAADAREAAARAAVMRAAAACGTSAEAAAGRAAFAGLTDGRCACGLCAACDECEQEA